MTRAAAILGGGPSLLSDFEHVPKDAVTFGCNHHALMVGIVPDYLVFMDDPHCKPNLLKAVTEFRGIKVSKVGEYSDIDLSQWDYWLDLSSMTATWLALHLGHDPVLLCGMDLYQGEQKYCHDSADDVPGAIVKRTLDQHLKHWRKAFEMCEHPERIRAVSGPLTTLFTQSHP